MQYLKAAVFTFNLLTWILGCTVFFTGAWLLMDFTKGHLYNVFVLNLTPQETIKTIAYCLISLGLAILFVGFLGCKAMFQNSQRILLIYVICLIGLIVTEVISSAVLGTMTYRASSGLEARLADKMSLHYGHDPQLSDIPFSQSFDYAQYKFNCCGIHSDKDYNASVWWKNREGPNAKRQVPLTCCVLRDTESKNTGSPMSVISRVIYQNSEFPWLTPQAKDESACESEDFEIHSKFRHKEGCLDKVTYWLQYENYTVVGFAIAMSVVHAVGVTLTALLFCKVRDGQNVHR